MLDRWAELREILEAGLLWQAPDRLKAVRLLGKQPLDAATDWRVMKLYFSAGAMTPAAKQDFKDLADEMFTEQKKIFVERVQGRLVPGVRPNDPESGKAALLELIAEEEERLEALLAEHLERTEPIVGESFDATDAGERLRRYQAACDRGLLRVLETLRKRHRDADGGRGPSRLKKEAAKEAAAPDLSRRIEGLLNLMAAAKKATNEATVPPGPNPTPVTPARPAPPEPTGETASTPQTPTIEPNRAARPAWFGPMIVLALVAAIGIAAASATRAWAAATVAAPATVADPDPDGPVDPPIVGVRQAMTTAGLPSADGPTHRAADTSTPA